MTGTSREDEYKGLVISRPVLWIIRNVSDRIVEKIKRHILCSIIFLNRAVYGIMLKNIVEPDKATDVTMPHAHCMLCT